MGGHHDTQHRYHRPVALNPLVLHRFGGIGFLLFRMPEGIEDPGGIGPYSQATEHHGYANENRTGKKTPDFKEAFRGSEDIEEEGSMKTLQQIIGSS
jgi:hypothetical protein